LVLSRDGEEAHGSGRSIPAFHLLQALESCPELFSRFGGHAHAVGFSLPSLHIAQLQQSLDEYARARLTLDDFVPIVKIDAHLPVETITPQFMEALAKLEPFGTGNQEPVFSATARVAEPPRVVKDKHVQLKLSPADGAAAGWRKSLKYKAMAWRLAERVEQEKLLAGDTLEVAFTLDHNDHPEFGGIELSLRDFQTMKAATRSA
jgi:single-stranded-DNA-specific exonuclease